MEGNERKVGKCKVCDPERPQIYSWHIIDAEQKVGDSRLLLCLQMLTQINIISSLIFKYYIFRSDLPARKTAPNPRFSSQTLTDSPSHHVYAWPQLGQMFTAQAQATLVRTVSDLPVSRTAWLPRFWPQRPIPLPSLPTSPLTPEDFHHLPGNRWVTPASRTALFFGWCSPKPIPLCLSAPTAILSSSVPPASSWVDFCCPGTGHASHNTCQGAGYASQNKRCKSSKSETQIGNLKQRSHQLEPQATKTRRSKKQKLRKKIPIQHRQTQKSIPKPIITPNPDVQTPV